MLRHHHGFSLVELSIVLVILGLLTGGILAGQSLIRASELRSVGTEYHRYLTATQAFRDKYFAIPGDITNATSFWGAQDAVAATCRTTASSSPLTCNGNGDGMILNGTSYEHYRFWQHLANAGLIEGQYDGITHGATHYSSTTANSPISKRAQGLWYVRNTTYTTFSYAFDGNYGNYFQLGLITTDAPPNTPILLPEEAWNLDSKLDDGKPGTGKMVVYAANGLNFCTTVGVGTQYNGDYLLSATSAQCAPIFRNLF